MDLITFTHVVTRAGAAFGFFLMCVTAMSIYYSRGRSLKALKKRKVWLPWLYRAVVKSLVDGFGRRPVPRMGDVDEFGRHWGSCQGSIGMLLVKGPGHAADVEGRAVRGDPA